MSAPPVRIQIDGREVEAHAGEMLIAVADRIGVHIPRFCYHPRLTVAANCRMCLVEVAGARGPAPACATPVAEGMEVHTLSETARDAQRSTMEFLLLNHPLDCPICDQGGECELQDTALEYGHAQARTTEPRRVVPDPDLGPLVSTDMTRCIHCTRCVRFTEEIAGDMELGAFGRGEFMKIGTYVQKALHSELSGCVIDLCPVGALNARPSRMHARAWEMTRHRSTGEHDGVGSQLYHHCRRGGIVRTVPCETPEINQSWLSDRDRFSYQACQHPDRVTEPMEFRDGRWEVLGWDVALDRVCEALGESADKVGLIQSSSTVEECALFAQLLRGAGARTVEHRLRMSDFRGTEQYPRTPDAGGTIDELESEQAILLIGAYPRHDQPILGLRLRLAALAGTRVFSIEAAPNDWNFPMAGIRSIHAGRWLDELLEPAPGIVEALAEAEGAARILLGPMALAHPDASLLYTAARSLAARTGARLGTLAEGANAAGAWLTGCVSRRDGAGTALADGVDLDCALRGTDALWFLYGTDPLCDVADPVALRAALGKARAVIGFQAFLPPPGQYPCDLLLPLPTVGERSGHLLSLEGRWHALQGAGKLPGAVRAGSATLAELAHRCGIDLPWGDAEELLAQARARLEAGPAEPAAVDAGTAQRRCPSSGLLRLGTASVYQQDAATRHAHALQQTELAGPATLAVHPDTLRQQELQDASRLRIHQGEASIVLPARADARVPEGCVYLESGDPALATLGDAFGEVRLSHA